MPQIQCVVKDENGVQCLTTREVSEPIAAKISFMCSNHTDSALRAAAGNTKTPRPDVHFQEVQFDPDMERGAQPLGTSHIPNPKDRGKGTPPLSAYIVPPEETEVE